MQQFKVLLKKEMRSYFRSYFAYAIFFIYLFVSIGCAFYFGTYLSMHDASVYALFYVQPIILVVLIPALTMKLWSEEYKSGTAEFLLTQPVTLSKIAVAKTIAPVLFCWGMSFFFLPFIGYTGSWLQLDLGNIISCYFGVWLVMLLFCVLGSLISALNKNIILSYLLSVFCMILWVALPYSYLYNFYNDFLMAEIGIIDVLYFVSFAAVLFIINVMYLQQRCGESSFKRLKFSGFCFLALMGAVVLNTAFGFVEAKMDVTSFRTYTLKPESLGFISELKEPINIDVYVAKDFINQDVGYYRYYQQVERFLKKYQRLSGGMVQVNVKKIEPFSEMEEKVLNYGLYFEENASGSRNFFGAIITKGEKYTVIKHFIQERAAFLEKDIDSAILRLVSPQVVKNVGVYLDATQDLQVLEGLMINIESDYNVVNVPTNIYEIPSALDLMLVVNPKQLPSMFMYALDQYIMRGGKIIFFFDVYTESQSMVTNMKNISIVDFLSRWGVELRNEQVDDGVLNPLFGLSDNGIGLFRALTFDVKNGDLQVMPFIQNGNSMVGAVLQGSIPSMYSHNPYIDTESGKKMSPHLSVAKDGARVAIVGDVDLLDDEMWIANNSPDKNPYSIIEKKVNGRAVRSLIDFMADNMIYLLMPQSGANLNTFSIGQQIDNSIKTAFADDYTSLVQNIDAQRLALYQSAGEKTDKFQEMLQVSESGRKIVAEEKKLQNLEYEMKQAYSQKVQQIIFSNVFLIPFIATLLLFLLAFLVRRRKNIKIKEYFRE